VAWYLLFLAGVLEVIWTWAMKMSQGFTEPRYTVLVVACILATTWLLSIVVKSLPLGTAYAVWVGIGIVGTATVGIFVFHESASPARIASIAMIVAGVVTLNLLEGRA
jgi:quaternary ammonium compound-resistance protein SugE